MKNILECNQYDLLLQNPHTFFPAIYCIPNTTRNYMLPNYIAIYISLLIHDRT